MLVDRMKNTNGIPIPDITVSVWNENGSVYDSCLYENDETIESCIEKTENNLPQLDSIVLGFKKRKSIDVKMFLCTKTSLMLGQEKLSPSPYLSTSAQKMMANFTFYLIQNSSTKSLSTTRNSFSLLKMQHSYR